MFPEFSDAEYAQYKIEDLIMKGATALADEDAGNVDVNVSDDPWENAMRSSSWRNESIREDYWRTAGEVSWTYVTQGELSAACQMDTFDDDQRELARMTYVGRFLQRASWGDNDE